MIGRIVLGVGLLAIAAATAQAARERGLREVRPRPPRSKPRRKPPEAGLAVPAVPPRGPLPKQGGAAAALEFDA